MVKVHSENTENMVMSNKPSMNYPSNLSENVQQKSNATGNKHQT